MRYRFYTCDVFTETRFGGNPLAVIPEAQGLSDAQMQQIAREFNYSETTFVFPPAGAHTRHVRIFTPLAEVPFAGHPNIGTAFVLASTGALEGLGPATKVTFEERAGVVPIAIEATAQGTFRCELEAPEVLSLGAEVAPELAAAALSLAPADVLSTTHPPRVASVGLPFLFVELRGREALSRAASHPDGLASLRSAGAPDLVHPYVQSRDDFDVRARMFAPSAGVPEDPATGSANCALGGLLAHYAPARDGEFRYRIAQGVELGRPSVLVARAEKRAGRVVAARIGGDCVAVAEGWIEVE